MTRECQRSRRVFLHPLWLLVLLPLLWTHVAWVNETGTWTWQRIGYWSFLRGERTGPRAMTPAIHWVLVMESDEGIVSWHFDHGLNVLDLAIAASENLGTIDMLIAEDTRGVFAPTSRTFVVGLDYWTRRSGPGMPPAAFTQDNLDELAERMLAWRWLYAPDTTVPTGDSLNAPLPKHSSWFEEIVLAKRRILSGYVHNTVFVIAVIWALLTAHALWRDKAWRRWRRAEWQCAQCGYDRRGLDDDAQCPECGHLASGSLTSAD